MQKLQAIAIALQLNHEKEKIQITIADWLDFEYDINIYLENIWKIQ